MTHLIETCGRKIDVIKQQIIFNDKITQVRPKTFQLLLQFLHLPQQLLSKKYLLEHVWDDVEVSDQVLFQTIREIRNLFEGEEIISTQPRKGYVWVAPVSSFNRSESLQSKWQENIVFKSLVAACSILMLFFAFQFITTDSEEIDGSLVILPVKSDIADNAHNWVYLGAMHQIISRFNSNDNLAVLSPEHVLNVMREAELPNDYSAEQLQRIFDVSGANLIVETNLTGVVQDYKLNYKLHFRDDVKRGVVFDNTINGATDQITKILTEYTGIDAFNSQSVTQSNFANELMARAIEKRESGQYQSSNDLLSALLITDNNNVIAHRVMATNYIAMKAHTKAEHALEQALSLTRLIGSEQLPVIHYYQALIEFIEKDHNAALSLLDIAETSAKEQNNWLYRAYSNELKGKIYMKTGQLELATKSFTSALQHHAIIQCPVGTSQSLMSLSRVAKLSGNHKLALNYLTQAADIIEKRELTFLNQDLTFVRNKVI